MPCLFDYYRTGLLPFWWTLARVESRRQHYFRDEPYTNRTWEKNLRQGSVSSRNWGRPSRKAVWTWDLRLASLLTHLLSSITGQQGPLNNSARRILAVLHNDSSGCHFDSTVRPGELQFGLPCCWNLNLTSPPAQCTIQFFWPVF